MTGMNERLASANGVLKGLARFESYELVSRIDAFMCTMFCIYQLYKRITIVML
jgi:hypothetical protein